MSDMHPEAKVSSIPDHVAQPQDHLPPAEPPVVTDDELLRDLPELMPPHKLRIRQKNKIMKLAFKMRDVLPSAEDGSEAVEIDFDELNAETLDALLDVLADVDDFAESIATDAAAYVAWSQGADYEHMTALLGRYSSAVGESISS